MITVHEEAREFHLSTDSTSYVLCILPNGLPGSLHYGPRLDPGRSYRHLGAFAPSRYVPLVADRFPTGFLPESSRAAWEANPATASLSASRVRMEFSTSGRGDFRQPSFSLVLPDGTGTTCFAYRGSRLVPGLPSPAGLPRLDEGGEEGLATLELEFADEAAGLELCLSYAVLPHLDLVVRGSRLRNVGSGPVTVTGLLSLSLDLPDPGFDLLQLSGSVVRERSVYRSPLRPGYQGLTGRGGTSGSFWHNPFLALPRPATTEEAGEVYAFNLLYSGDFQSGVEVDPFGVARVGLGLSPEGLSWRLEPGSSFESPLALAYYGEAGLGAASRAFHGAVRRHLVPRAWRGRPRPVVCNSWEAAYFDFDEGRLLELAAGAARLGAEVFVVDDGWFGRRRNDRSSLGDWVADPRRFPRGLGAFADDVRALGLGLGLWFEPEMVSPDSDFYREDPSRALRTCLYEPLTSRNQLVLDFSDPATVDRVYRAMEAVIREARPAYLKLDMNRMMTDVASARLPAAGQGEVRHRHILGVYTLYRRLAEAFPEILIESCASGGGRFDLGLLAYAPQAWTSDNSDPVARLAIQGGTSLAYPPETMACHVSPVPNHQVGRTTSLGLRAAVALFGSFGLELDPEEGGPREGEELAAWVALAKDLRRSLLGADLYRLTYVPGTAWLLVAPDRSLALFGAFGLLQDGDPPYRRTRLRGLDPSREYRLAWRWGETLLREAADPGLLGRIRDQGFCRDRRARGDELMGAGLLLDDDLALAKAGLLAGSPDFPYRLCVLEAASSDAPGPSSRQA